MNRPERCPVCRGRGKYTIPMGKRPAGRHGSFGLAVTERRDLPCLVCNGSGVVWKPAEQPATEEATA